MEIKPSLKSVLKRLRLSGVLATLPDRIAYARKAKLSEEDFFELVLQDEIDRREQSNLAQRLTRACFAEPKTLEDFDWNAPIHFDRDRVRDLFSLGFLHRHEDVVFMGPTGVGKTFLASALGHAACRAGFQVLFVRADDLFKHLLRSRADHSHDKTLRRFLLPELLIIDDFALRRMDSLQSSDIYQLVLERHRRSSSIVTSNRSIEEWIPLFEDPLLAQSALDRLANNAHQIVVEGDSYRRRLQPASNHARPPEVKR